MGIRVTHVYSELILKFIFQPGGELPLTWLTAPCVFSSSQIAWFYVQQKTFGLRD